MRRDRVLHQFLSSLIVLTMFFSILLQGSVFAENRQPDSEKAAENGEKTLLTGITITGLQAPEIGKPLPQGAHQKLRSRPLFPFERRESEIQQAVPVLLHQNPDAEQAFQRVHAGASQRGDPRADDVASAFSVSAVSGSAVPGEPALFPVQDGGDHYALIAVISTLV